MLIALEEAGAQYTTYAINYPNTPSWFVDINPVKKVSSSDAAFLAYLTLPYLTSAPLDTNRSPPSHTAARLPRQKLLTPKPRGSPSRS